MTKYIKEMNQSGYLAVLYQALVKYDKVYEGNESEWIPCGVIPSSGLVWQKYIEKPARNGRSD